MIALAGEPREEEVTIGSLSQRVWTYQLEVRLHVTRPREGQEVSHTHSNTLTATLIKGLDI
jgi:hypothetical protein